MYVHIGKTTGNGISYPSFFLGVGVVGVAADVVILVVVVLVVVDARTPFVVTV